ncbi:MAG: hypothetical protein J3T61_09585 [Candidatus Brocadiales bacterium]|nr:hypothetical protein [Candidatus Bathyanammoxibius sp.]
MAAKRGRPVEPKLSITDRYFAALVALTNTPAAAFQAMHPQSTMNTCTAKGTLLFARPGVEKLIKRFRGLQRAQTERLTGMTDAETDRAMLKAQLSIVESADATAQDKARAATAYATLRKTLQTDVATDTKGDDSDTPADLASFLAAVRKDRNSEPDKPGANGV